MSVRMTSTATPTTLTGKSGRVYIPDEVLQRHRQDPNRSIFKPKLRCARNWFTVIDIKPDNILVNWTRDEEGNRIITDVALGDFDIAFTSENGEALQTPSAIGNCMWRSPERQTGRGVTKASDMFSFGLVCIYALGGGDLLILSDYEELVKHDIVPEQEIVTRHFCYFGPLPEGLLKHVNDENWGEAFKESSKVASRALTADP
ncbi:hypothetical protein O1611_g9178 [Lasiodiplodia mahajangana]|uniref:Uncharacterized protein n=1 Tax=Lasiodiplodia mahajangana TaxID=1108764 RepID=A0ACC2JAC8_9PEZI|nr:hypothetical protein O1611_g9178 [Lasiodiplodia mahajangana]